jgi:hypothetical protein
LSVVWVFELKGSASLARVAGENDPVAHIVAQMTQFNDGLEAPSRTASPLKATRGTGEL